MSVRHGSALVAAAVRAACDAKAPRRTIAAVAAAAVSAALRPADAPAAASVMVPGNAACSPSAGGDTGALDDDALVRRLRQRRAERRQRKRQQRREAKAAVSAPGACDTSADVEMVPGIEGTHSRYSTDAESGPTSAPPTSSLPHEDRADGGGSERSASSSIATFKAQSSRTAPDWLPAAWRNNFIGYCNETPPHGASFDRQGRLWSSEPSTTPLPSEAIKPGRGRGN